MAGRVRWGEVWRSARHVLYAGVRPEVRARSAGLARLRAAAVVGIGLWSGFLAAQTTPGEPAGSPLALGLAAASAVPAIVAVRSPLWAWRLLVVLILVTPFVSPGLPRLWGWPWSPGLALTAALVWFLVAAGHAQAVLVVVGVVSAAAMSGWVGDWRDLALLVALMTAVLLAGNAVRQRRVAELESAEQQRGRAAEETRAAVLEERARIARELHDVVAHHMSVLALRTDSARYRFPGLPDDLRTEFAELTGTAREGMVEMRRLLGVLRTESTGEPVAPQPDVTRVTELAERVRALGATCAVRVHGEFDALPAGVALSAYRIVQEALSNAVRHAPGAAIDVELRVGAGSVRAAVRNAPSGPVRPAGTAGHGLLGMRERAAMLGGTLVAGPTADGGFEVTAELPLDHEENA
ncbi:sensor histidine kinase [Amycolatopsis sp. cmx-4-68]|uniref:sensor histidine kinase n=1 Tax=Amycolatopsis sp. cmx-4-68 TaxID=2790938 RepID=UPI00397E3C9D